MRVLARREPVDPQGRSARRPGSADDDLAEAEVTPAAARAAAARAAKRRLRVVLLILAANVAVAALAYFGYLGWSCPGDPGGRARRLAGRLPADGEEGACRAPGPP